MKKCIKLLCIAAVYLVSCYGIGQYRNIHNKNVDEVVNENKTEEISAEHSEEHQENTLDVWNNVVFEGVRNTEDTPWNFNAGVIDVDGNECFLLTPNTSMTLKDISKEATVSFEYEIHPWVRENSDGAGLLVWVLDSEDNILFEDNIIVENSVEWCTYELNIKEYPKAVSVKIYCNNGQNNDDSADWVILHGNEIND